MPVPCAALDALLLLSAVRLRVSLPLLGVLLVIPFRPLLLSVLCLPVLLLWLCLPLSMLLLRLGLLVLALLLSGLRPLLLLGVLLLLILFRPLLSMLLRGPRLRGLGLLLFGMILFFARLLVLGIGRTRDSEKQRQNGCAGNSNYFQRVSLLILRLQSATQY